MLSATLRALASAFLTSPRAHREESVQLLAVACLEASHAQEAVQPSDEISRRLATVSWLWTLQGAGVSARVEAHVQRATLLARKLPQAHAASWQVRFIQMHALARDGKNSQMQALGRAIISESMRGGQWQWVYAFLWQQTILSYELHYCIIGGAGSNNAVNSASNNAVSSASNNASNITSNSTTSNTTSINYTNNFTNNSTKSSFKLHTDISKPLLQALQLATTRGDTAIRLAFEILSAHMHLSMIYLTRSATAHNAHSITSALDTTQQHLTTAQQLMATLTYHLPSLDQVSPPPTEPHIACLQMYLSMLLVLYHIYRDNYSKAIQHLHTLHATVETSEISDSTSDDNAPSFLSGNVTIPVVSMTPIATIPLVTIHARGSTTNDNHHTEQQQQPYSLKLPNVTFRFMTRNQLYATVYLLSAVANKMDLSASPNRVELFCTQGKTFIHEQCFDMSDKNSTIHKNTDTTQCSSPTGYGFNLLGHTQLLVLGTTVQLTRQWTHTLIARGQLIQAKEAISELVNLVETQMKYYRTTISTHLTIDSTNAISRLKHSLILDLAMYAQATGSFTTSAQYYRYLIKTSKDINVVAIAKLNMVSIWYAKIATEQNSEYSKVLLAQIRRLLDTFTMDNNGTLITDLYDPQIIAAYKLMSTLTLSEVNKRKRALLDSLRLAQDNVQVKTLALALGGHVFQATNVEKAENMYTHGFHLAKRAGIDVMSVVCWDRMNDLFQQQPLEVARVRIAKDASYATATREKVESMLCASNK